MKRVTFRELYNSVGEKLTPRQAFLQECAELTGASISTVKQWAYGVQKPNKAAIKLLSERFGCKAEGLFPEAAKTVRTAAPVQ